jgi:hypothetical protein
MRDREAAQACEADKERKRERDRRAKEAGPDAIRKGNTLFALIRPRVLVMESDCIKFMLSSTRINLYH